jgi:hypothetical protein
MTVRDVVNSIIGTLPSVAAGLLLIAALVAIGIFIAGFHKYGLDFIKHGSKQKDTAGLGEKIDGIAAQLEEFRTEMAGIHTEMANFHAEMEGIHTELGGFRTELQTIKVNHFGRLKDFLSELTSILLDKDIINNQDKARLDNKLRGM